MITLLHHISRVHTLRHRRAATFATAALAALLVGAHAGHAEPRPFVIAVDGMAIDGSGTITDAARHADAGLAATGIRLTFDGLGVTPILNVSTVPPRIGFAPGESVRFATELNYPAFVSKRELRIFDADAGPAAQPWKVLAVPATGVVDWQMPADAPAEMTYVFRVYDAAGRFDETEPLPLHRDDQRSASRPVDVRPPAAILRGEDRTAVRNIPVSGGAVTVHGSEVPADHQVSVLGEPVPVARDGSFVVQRILPPGPHAIEVAVLRNGDGLWFTRDIDIPDEDWFQVALADLTAGLRDGKGAFDDVHTRGRLAFYLKGKIKGSYLLTAAADTGEENINKLFTGLDGKDPRQFLNRIDPDDYYPVYGDDSSAIEDAPTRGKFYIRLDSGASHVMWGNFRSAITGTEFLRSNRALYGAHAVHRSAEVTAAGEPRTNVDAYVAQPGTVPQRDVLRATGGSAYFLKHRDITPGSETIVIEERNATTGWAVARRTLRDGEDYVLDHLQGVLLLKTPLASTGPNGTENFVVADYEFTPAAGDTDGYVTGGRASGWIGEHVRLGVTGMTDRTGTADQTLAGADLRLQRSPETYLEAEIARSEGPGFGSTYSADGGLTLQDAATAGGKGRTAEAWRVKARAALADLTEGKVSGTLGARYEEHGKGFSSREINVRETRRAWGADADIEIADGLRAAAAYSELHIDDGSRDREGLVKVRKQISNRVSIEPFGRYTEKERVAPARDTGHRGDAGLRGTYAWDERTEVFVFGQATVVRAGKQRADNRGGVGGKRQLTEKIDASAEVSYGSLGPDVAVMLGYSPTVEDHYYAGYRLDAARATSASWPFDLTGRDLGTVVAGARRRISAEWLAYAEDNYDMFGVRRALTQAYGVTWTPDSFWNISGSLEIGHVFDDTIDPSTGRENPDFDRQAISLSALYRDADRIDGKAKGEIRLDDSEDDSRDVSSYLAALALGLRTSDDWRALASLDAVISDASASTRDGRYVEASLGLAYRPAASDRFNALAKYTFLYDLPGADQVSVDGTANGPLQVSHIAAVDASLDLTPQLTLGGKYGIRVGEQKLRDPAASWDREVAQLGVLRADFHVVHGWDALLEVRGLWNADRGDIRTGFLAAIYRHFGDTMKLGIGYNFGGFSDDLRDLVHDDRGVFINLVGKL